MKPNKQICLFALLGSISFSAFSQQFQDAVQPKQNISKSSGVSSGMDLSTGTANPSIPVMSLPTRSGLNVDVTLVYTGGQGLRATELASRVGWGWAINTGGRIDREVKGIRDEKKHGEALNGTDDIKQSGWCDPYGYFNTSLLIHREIYTEASSNPTDEYTYDGIPCNAPISLAEFDQISFVDNTHICDPGTNLFCGERVWTYQANFPVDGIRTAELVDYFRSQTPSGSIPADIWKLEQKKFFFDAQQNNQYAEINYDTEPDVFTFSFGNYNGNFVFDKNGVPVIYPYQDIKIEPAFGANPSTIGWIFTTPDGFKYIFKNTDTESTLVSHDYVWNGSTDSHAEVSTWFLSTIVEPLGSQISFTYRNTGAVDQTIQGQIEPDFILGTHIDLFKDCINNNCAIPTNASKINLRILNKVELDRISSDLGTIEFLEGYAKRYDMPSTGSVAFYPLKNIQLKDIEGRISKKFEFDYDYFGAATCTTYYGAAIPSIHLKLAHFKEMPLTGTSDPLLYTFSYENFTDVITSNRYNFLDKWGYYNNDPSYTMPSTSCSTFNAPCYAINSLILKNEPQGRTEGATRLPSYAFTKEGVLNQITNPLGGVTNYEYELNNYFNTTTNQNENWGGLRIKKIIDKPNGNSSSLQSVKEFKYYTQADHSRSSGEVQPLRRQFDFTDYYNSSGVWQAQYLLRYSNANRDNARDFIRYTHVEVVESGNGKRTYDYSGFTSNPDVSAERWKFDYSNATPWTQYFTDRDNDAGAPQSDYSMYRGLLLHEANYMELPSGSSATENDLKIEETNYEYEFEPTDFVNNVVIPCRVNCNEKLYQASSNASCAKTFNVEYYTIKNDWLFLKRVSKKSFAPINSIYDPSRFSSNEIEYEYNSYHPSQLKMERSQNSDEKITVKRFVYPSDFIDNPSLPINSDESWAIRKMIEAYQINSPLEIYVNDETDPSVPKTINSLLVLYKDYGLSAWNKNMFMPSQILNERFPVPIENFVPIHFSDDGSTISLSYDANYQIDYYYDQYDNFGHCLNEHRDKGSFTSHLWGYSGSILPIAEFKNAKNENRVISGSPYSISGNECSYLGFESYDQPQEGDYWYYIPVASRSPIISTDAHTGKRCQKILEAGNAVTYSGPIPSTTIPINARGSGPFSYSASHVFTPDNQNRIYKLSAWVKTSSNFQTGDAWLVMDVQHKSGTEILDQTSQQNNLGYHYCPIPNSPSDWKFIEITIDLEEFRTQNAALLNSSDNQLNILCYVVNYDNTANNYILLDDIRFSPIDAIGSTLTYNFSRLISSVSNENNIPTYVDRDEFNRDLAVENYKHEVLSYSQYFSSSSYNGNNPNFIKSLSTNVPYTLSEIQNNNFNVDNVISTKTCLDGNGRTIQKIVQNFFTDLSSNKFDLIQTYSYDQYGRQINNYLPYSYAANGNFDSNFITHLTGFYSNADKVAHDTKPYSTNVFESSSTSRVLESKMPGNAWFSSSHSIKHNFDFNSANEVKKWEVLRNGSNELIGAKTMGYFQESTILKTKLISEENKVSFEFYDKSGKIICKKVEAYTDANNKTHDFTVGSTSLSGGSAKLYSTYYVYDEFNQLVYNVTIQNDASGSFSDFTDDENLTDPIFKGFVEAIHYDSHGRVIAKHACDKDWEYFAYNALDKVVLSQNSKLRADNEWLVSKYDGLGRVVATGTSDLGGQTQSQVQESLNQDVVSYVKRTSAGTNGYTFSDTYPFVIDNMLTINYYDKYNLQNSTLAGRDYIQVNSDDPQTYSKFTIGKPTASLVKVLGSGDMLATLNYYDDLGRQLEQQKQNYIDYPNSWDISINKTAFNGQVLKNTRVHNAFGNTLHVVTRYTYDRLNRRTDIYKKIHDEAEVHMVNYTYNSLGQTVRKIIHDQPVWDDSFLQGIDYRYNIRGWLTSINNAELSNDGVLNLDANDVFGEQLFYEQPTISTTTCVPIPLFDGKISQMLWRTKPASGAVSFDLKPIHLYTYRYDDFGRLTAGYYGSNSEPNPISYNTNLDRYLEKESYDIRGNITELTRNSEKGTPIDNLIYSYFPKSNQISSISDIPNGNLQLNDFHDGVTSTGEYNYDAAGNTIRDDNKGVNMEYNFFNLIQRINGSTAINYTYDALGTKLASTIGGVSEYFVNGIEYTGNALTSINTEEGRARISSIAVPYSEKYVFDYFIKDHLGNIRVVLTTEDKDNSYFATMEPQNNAVEEQVFYNISSTREDKLVGYPIDNSYSPDIKASVLSTATNKTIGHAKVLEVNGSDVVHLNVRYYFKNAAPDSTSHPLSEILNGLAMSFIINPSNGNSVAGSELGDKQNWAENTFINNPELTSFLTQSYSQNEINNPDKPKAFLVWLMFSKKDFKFIPSSSGLLPVTDAEQLGNLGIMDLKMPEAGYLYVYVSNETTRTVDFDHLSIIHKFGRYVEENHYYPYGMLIEGLSSVSKYAPSNYKFNGDYYETRNELYNYLTPFRTYDPSIARWNQIDPINEFSNGYFAYGGNPVSFSDPTGLKNQWGNKGNDQGDEPRHKPIDPNDNPYSGGGLYASSYSKQYHDNEWYEYYGTSQDVNDALKNSGMTPGDYPELKSVASLIYFSESRGCYGYWNDTYSSGTEKLEFEYNGSGETHESISEPVFTSEWIGVSSDQGNGGGNSSAVFWNNLNTGIGVFDVGQGAKGELLNYAAKSSPAINDLKYVKGLKVLGGATFVASSLISGGLATNYYMDGGTNYSVGIKASLDIIMGGVGFLGPIGFGISATYFLLDAGGAFGGYGDPLLTPKK